jgi:hypothetical protein
VLDADLADLVDPSLRAFLTGHLQSIRSALEEYELTGSFRLNQEVRSAVGDFATDRPTISTEVERSLWDRFVEFSKNIIIVTTAVVQLSIAPANIVQAYSALDHDRPAQSRSQESPALTRAPPVPELGPAPSHSPSEPDSP